MLSAAMYIVFNAKSAKAQRTQREILGYVVKPVYIHVMPLYV